MRANLSDVTTPDDIGMPQFDSITRLTHESLSDIIKNVGVKKILPRVHNLDRALFFILKLRIPYSCNGASTDFVI